MANASHLDADCPVCSDRVRCPATLHCGHSLCLPCLVNESRKVENFTCPRCQATFSSRYLRNGQGATDFVERPELQLGEGKLCEECRNEKSAGETFCLKCDMFLCEMHVKEHRNNTTLASHVLVAPGTCSWCPALGGQDDMNQDVGEDEPVNKPRIKNSVAVHKDLHLVYGKSLLWTTPSDFVKVTEIQKKPNVQISETLEIVKTILPYIRQFIKMWGVSTIHAANISQLAHDDVEACQSGASCNRPSFAQTSFVSKAASSSVTSNKRPLNKVPLSRLDCLVALLSSADCTVLQDLIQIMSKFPVALPLVMPNLEKKGEYKVMLPLLAGNTVKWEVKPGVIIENNIFTDPFILILCVRLGNGTCGKSTILNQLMAVENMFSSCDEPGAHRGKPLTLDGTVEFTWLTEETCGERLWKSVLQQFYAGGRNEVVLLANLHGDPSEFPEVIQFLTKFTSAYIVFIMPEERKRIEVKWNIFVQRSGSGENIHYFVVDPDKGYNDPEDNVIQTTRLTNDKTIEKVRAVFKTILNSVAPTFKSGCKPDFSNLGKTLQLSDGIRCFQSQLVIDFVSEKTCEETKNIMLFQKNNAGKRNPQEFWNGNRALQELVRLYGGVLRLPLSERLKAMAHLEQSISQLSISESSNLRQTIMADREEFQRQILLKGKNELMIDKMKNKMKTNMKKLDQMSLGPEHFFRELGHIYELTDEGRRQNGALMECPRSYAELLISGHAIELLNGDTGEMPGAWLTAICNHITKAYPNLRIFVISILGLQSSGKSTLLNALFACKFAVSVGRCTRGLFMRLLFLEEKLSERLKADAILLIDTEGLGAAEKMNDEDAEKKDRMLATFAMSVSNLTIINVLGEYMRDLTEILQIAIVAMARLENAKMSPDILMVQHLTERNTSKTSSGQEQFCKALENALELTKEKDVDMGILDMQCLTSLANRIQKGELLKQFRPFKNGASAGAPPSEQYHADVVDLYETILNACEKSNNTMPFSDWHSLVQSFWSCVTNENFVVRFKNIKEIYDFIDRGKRIASLKEATYGAFSLHVEDMKSLIRSEVTQWTPEKQREKHKKLLKRFENELDRVPLNCLRDNSNNLRCQRCTEVIKQTSNLNEYVTQKQCEQETMETIHAYTKHVHQSALTTLTQILDATIMKHGCSVEFMEVITRNLKTALGQRPAGKFSECERKMQVEEIWGLLETIAKSKDSDIPDCKKLNNEMSEEYHAAPNVISRCYDESPVQDFGQREAFDKTIWQRIRSSRKVMNESESSWLQNRLDTIPQLILRGRAAEHFELGMICLLKKEVDCILSAFEKSFMKQLLTEIKWDAHVYTLKIFSQLMWTCQKNWENKHSPISILKQREEEFRSLIDRRLQHGFSCASEGGVISNYLVDAIKQKSVKAVNCKKVQAVRKLQWTTNSEKVRLHYFERLASQVNEGKSSDALQHFRNPNDAINKWFIETINNHARGKETTQFKKTFETELDNVLINVESCKDINEVFTYTQKYFTDAGDIEYTSYLSNKTISKEDFLVLKDRIQNGLKELTSKVDCERLTFIDPSSNETIMGCLGCTEQCFWCGALCWGSKGHDNNTDETRKHHSSHQPRGLSSTHYIHSTNLVAMPCHLRSGDTIVHWGNNKMTWSEAKQTHFTNWIFDAHFNVKFDELMRWFFQELHKEIATSRKLLPASEDELKKFKCENLYLGLILSTIREHIK